MMPAGPAALPGPVQLRQEPCPQPTGHGHTDEEKEVTEPAGDAGVLLGAHEVTEPAGDAGGGAGAGS